MIDPLYSLKVLASRSDASKKKYHLKTHPINDMDQIRNLWMNMTVLFEGVITKMKG